MGADLSALTGRRPPGETGDIVFYDRVIEALGSERALSAELLTLTGEHTDQAALVGIQTGAGRRLLNERVLKETGIL